MYLEFLVTISYIALFIYFISKVNFFQVDSLSKRILPLVFSVKILCGVLLAIIYTYYYTDRSTADTFKYFDDSKIMFDALHTNPTDFLKMFFGIDDPALEKYYRNMITWNRQYYTNIADDNHAFIRLNAFLRFFSFGYYHVHSVFMNFLALIGLIAIYKFFIPLLPDKKGILIIAAFFIPSVLLWGSGVMKDVILLLSTGLFIFTFQKLLSKKFSFTTLLTFTISIVLLVSFKIYILLALLPGVITIMWIYKTSHRFVVRKFLVVVIVYMGIGLNIRYIVPAVNPFKLLAYKQADFVSLSEGNFTNAYYKPIPPAGSLIQLNPLEPTFSSFLENSPQALVNTIFRPFIWESKSPVMLVSALENIGMLLFMIVCIIFIKSLSAIRWEYVLFCLSFVIIQFLIIGYTTPNLGAIVRYKVPALPFLMIAFLLMLDKEKIRSLSPFRFMGVRFKV